MIIAITIVLIISLYFYILFGGADFGAGIIELFTGKRSEQTISKAIAPVWEANHIWLILAVVIVFNGFPKAYTTISTYLHIPIMIVLIGIIFRGASFTFRHYDIKQDRSHEYYRWIFRISSLVTPFFLGVTFGGMVSGEITLSKDVSFSRAYIEPWFNLLSISLGIFTTLLFAYIASIFLIGETENIKEKHSYASLARKLMFYTIASGLFVFISAEIQGLHFFKSFAGNPISICSIIVATILIPRVFIGINHFSNPLFGRINLAIQVLFIFIGWLAIRFPILISMEQSNLTLYNCHAPNASLFQLLIALLVGVCFIFPALYLLFKIFKSGTNYSAYSDEDVS